jgi:hypothetical protein
VGGHGLEQLQLWPPSELDDPASLLLDASPELLESVPIALASGTFGEEEEASPSPPLVSAWPLQDTTTSMPLMVREGNLGRGIETFGS